MQYDLATIYVVVGFALDIELRGDYEYHALDECLHFTITFFVAVRRRPKGASCFDLLHVHCCAIDRYDGAACARAGREYGSTGRRRFFLQSEHVACPVCIPHDFVLDVSWACQES